MIERIRRLIKRDLERGVAVPFVAIMLVLLIGMTAFAVDLGWLYLNGSRVQRGADAAALAGVVHLPANNAQVSAQSTNGANANGWHIGTVNGAPVVGGGPDSLTWQALSENRLEVSVTSTIPTFFLKVFGIDQLTMTRTATAEYIKPVPMGSPTACFGVGAFAAGLGGTQSLNSQGLGACSAWTMNFWAAINGRRTAKEHGDPYAVSHLAFNNNVPGGGCDATINATNDDYRPNGYYYGIEVPSNVTTFNVKIFDAGFYQRTNFQTEAGDGAGLRCSFGGGPFTEYRVFRPDATPLDPTDNSTLACSAASYAPESASPNTRNVWTTVCTVSSDTQGIFVLNVRTTGNGGGNNSYSVGVSTNGGPARVYAINDMSIFTNASAGTAFVYLAEVDPSHAGKTLQLGFYDPGENASNAWVTVQTPQGLTPNCNWNSVHDSGTLGPSGSGQCRMQSTIGGVAQFNAYWLNATVNIPNDYVCHTTPVNPNCFWRMALDMANSQDRTTWSARVIGNPVRLVPNEP